MKTTGRFHVVAGPIEVDLALIEHPGSFHPGNLCVHQRMAAVPLHRSALLHAGEQIRHRASLAVIDSRCSLLARRTLAQSLFVAGCVLSQAGQCLCIENRCLVLASTSYFISVNQAGWS